MPRAIFTATDSAIEHNDGFFNEHSSFLKMPRNVQCVHSLRRATKLQWVWISDSLENPNFGLFQSEDRLANCWKLVQRLFLFFLHRAGWTSRSCDSSSDIQSLDSKPWATGTKVTYNLLVRNLVWKTKSGVLSSSDGCHGPVKSQ